MSQREEIRNKSDAKRSKIVERDGNKCVICGLEAQLEVHHKLAIHNGGGAEEENLVTLCKPCHKHAPETGIDDFEEYRKSPGLSIWHRINARSDLNTQMKLGFYQYTAEKLDDWHQSGYISEQNKNRLLIREAELLDREFKSYLEVDND
ncbi:HNH endonuclease [Halobacillus karajensis]|uniref:HNH endonuclease n=1 Tax=Halobacillus karajensis TaxID=195088 RepID=A0A059NXV5_9BACI|nr:HNH endonuclease [Halobacillus karajensis]CDQ22631.1 HNH endonuclease [Halobacillus karajensis]CDQ26113.1 HNH endonuclease [Halobacillus karajensis]